VVLSYYGRVFSRVFFVGDRLALEHPAQVFD